MQSLWLISWLSVAVAAGVLFALVAVHFLETRRFVRSRIRRPHATHALGRVAVFAPCKGLDFGLEENLRPLFEQDHPDYQVTFIVERSDDPACEVIRPLMAQYPKTLSELVVSGQAVDTGQKVHNLRQATACLPSEVKYLAFVDSDARPPRDWLRRLVQRLDLPRAGAVTGYRWYVPERASFANHLLYSINASVAAGLGPGGHHLIWGGSWAIRRDVFEQLRLREAWHGTLSDDLVATSVLQRADLNIEFEPTTMLASPVDHDLRQTATFLRRQYVIARFYAKGYWLLAFSGAMIGLVTFWGGLGLLVAGLVQGAEWTWIPAFVCLLHYASTVFRGLLRRELAGLYLPEHGPAVRGAVRFDIWAAPLVAIFNSLAMSSSVVGSRLHWRGIGYRLHRGGLVRSVERDEAPATERGDTHEVPNPTPARPAPSRRHQSTSGVR
ncbi:MAG TPA: glycosyltransferase family 2 protein [Pirellulales bacterium]|nr:glycosyltransferase family 2 protein [Pirellulales bacterium]